MRTARLGDVVDFYSGGTPSKSKPELWQGNVPWFSAKDIKRPLLADSIDHVSDDVFTRTNLRRVSAGTVVMVVRGMILAHTVPIAVLDVDAAINQDLKALVPRKAVDPKFLAAMLRAQHPSILAQVTTAAHGTTKLETRVLENIQIPLPFIDEQRRIAAILDHADALRAKRRQLLAHLDDLAQSIFHDMFGDPVSNSLGVPVVPLEEWVQDGRPITYGILKPGPEVSNGVPYVRVADMKDGGIRTGGVRCTSSEIAVAYRRSVLQAGDLLMSIRGHVGRFAHVPDELSGGNITQDSARLAISDRATSTYVRAVMESPAIQHWMVRHTKGVAVRGLNIGDLRKVPIPQVALADRQTFACKVQSVGRQREFARAALTKENELFASLQDRAFAGEL